MGYQDLALPLDIPWKRLAASSDQMDAKHGDRSFPKKWRSSVAVFYHEPEDLAPDYCDRSITYLKIVCSVTGYQVGSEVGIAAPAADDRLVVEHRKLGELYHPCYAAMLQIGVFPYVKGGKSVGLSEYPYIVDCEPKRRELFEAVTTSAEVLGRSASTLNVRKGSTTTETTELAAKVGTETSASVPIEVVSVGAKVNTEVSARRGTGIEESNVRTTDDSREKRETFSSSTSLTQMYELFTAYHLGTNRALFYLVPRPHTVVQKDQYTFINGPRRLEGMQEVFLVVNRPKHVPGLCVEAYLETAHLFAAHAEAPPAVTTTSAKVVKLPPLSRNHRKEWSEGTGTGKTREFDLLIGYIPGNASVDRTRGGQPIDLSWRVEHTKWVCTSASEQHKMGQKQVVVPGGYYMEVLPGFDHLWESFDDVLFYESGNEARVKVTLHETLHTGTPRFQANFHVYLSTTETQTTTVEPPKPEERPLFLTGRGLSTCVMLDGAEERSDPAHVVTIDKWQEVGKVLEHSGFYAKYGKNLLETEREPDIGPDDLLERLKLFRDEQPDEFFDRLRRLIDRVWDDLPDGWRAPEDWITFETKVPAAEGMRDPDAVPAQRIRAANDLSGRIARTMIESLGSPRRHAEGTLDFWHSDTTLEHLAGVLREGDGDGGCAQDTLAELEAPEARRLADALGPEARVADLLATPADRLAERAGVGEAAVRDLKLRVLGFDGVAE